MDPWLFPNEIRHYLGQTFNARSSGVVELRNHSIGGRSPKSIFTLWQLWINICIFFQKFFLIVRTMPRPTLMGIRHEVFALAREGIKQGAIAARVGLTRATVNRILKRHAVTGSLVPGKSSGAPRKTTPRRDRALLRMVRQDRFLSAGALTARIRNLYGMRAGRTRVNNRLLSRGYRAYRPTTKPLLTANHRRLRLEWAQRWRILSPGLSWADQDGPLRPSTTAPTFFRELNAFLIMLKFSDSYETYRICSQQYLHSIWIVFGCMGWWGWGGGCRTRQDGLTSDSRPTKTAQCRRTCLFAIEYLLNDVIVFRQLWNLQDMFTTIFTFDLNSFWVYGVLGCGVGGDKPVKTDSRRIRADVLKYILNDVRIFRQLLNLQDINADNCRWHFLQRIAVVIYDTRQKLILKPNLAKSRSPVT